MGFRQNGTLTFASQKEADDDEIGYHLVGRGLYCFWHPDASFVEWRLDLTQKGFIC